MQIRIEYAPDNVFADTLEETGESVEGDPIGDGRFRLTSFAGAVPLVPGDVVVVRDGTLVDVHELADVWVMQILTRTPDLVDEDDWVDADWDAAQLATDELEAELKRMATVRRDSNYGITVVTETRPWFDSVVLGKPSVFQVWPFREPGKPFDLAHELRALGTDRIHMEGLL